MTKCNWYNCPGCSCHLNPPCSCCTKHGGICYVCEENEVEDLHGSCLECNKEEKKILERDE